MKRIHTQSPCSGRPLEVFHLGSAFEGLAMNGASWACTEYDPDFPEGRHDSLAYIYGECPPRRRRVGWGCQGGCVPPLQVQAAPLCTKHVGLYHDPLIGQLPYEALTILGVPAASLEDGETLEIYTGDTTITIFGVDAGKVRRAASQLRPALIGDIPARDEILTDLSQAADSVAPVTSLRPPDLAVLNKTEPCS